MSWDFGNNGNSEKVEFTKFPVGITRVRVVDDEPFMRWSHFLPKFNRSLNCPGKGCPICEIRKQQKANKEPYSYGVSRRLAIQVINRDTEKLEVMEQGIGFFEDLRDLKKDLAEQGLSLSDADIKVKRRGSGKDDTSYRLDIDEKYPLSELDIEIAKSKTNLSEFFKPNTFEQISRIVNGETWEEVMSSTREEDIEIK